MYRFEIKDSVLIITLDIMRAVSDSALEFKSYLSELIDFGKNKIIIDLTKCDYVDSSFTGSIVAAIKLANSNGADIKVVINQKENVNLVSLTKIDKVLKIEPTIKAALESFKNNNN